MDWKELLATADGLFQKVREIVVKGNDATPEEKENMQTMLDDAQDLKRRALALKAVDTAQLEIKALPHDEDDEQDPEKRRKTAEVPFLHWGEMLQSIWKKKAHNVNDPRLRWFHDSEAEGPQGDKTMTGNVGARGGFLIPSQFLAEMQAVMAEESLVRPTATIIRLERRQIALPVLDQTGALGAGLPNWFGGMQFFWADEGELKTETTPAFRKIILVAKKLIGYTVATDELLGDSAISLGDFLSGPLGFSGGISWMEDYSFLMGVGGGQPRGVINAPVTLAPTRVAANAISYVDCINMLEEFLPSARGQWLVTQGAMSELIQMSGPTANPSYVWQPSAVPGVQGMLFGMPVRFSEKMQPLGSRGDILVADFRYYLIGDRQATTIESSNAPRWQYDETSWRAVHRVDGQPWLSAPLTYQDTVTQVSPFVVLAAGVTS